MSTLLELFDVGAALDPKHTAVLFDDNKVKTQMTYEELAAAVNVVCVCLNC